MAAGPAVARIGRGRAEDLGAGRSDDEVGGAVARFGDDFVVGKRGRGGTVGIRARDAIVGRLALPVGAVERLGWRRRAARDPHRALDLARHDMPEPLARGGLHQPRVAAEGVLPPLGAGLDAAVGALVSTRVDPDELDRLVERVHEDEARRGALPAAAALAGKERRLEERAHGVAIGAVDDTATECEDDGFVAPLDADRDRIARDRDAAEREAPGVGDSEMGGERLVVEERAARGVGAGAGAGRACVGEPPAATAVARAQLEPEPRAVDPAAFAERIVDRRRGAREALARGGDRVARLGERAW